MTTPTCNCHEKKECCGCLKGGCCCICDCKCHEKEVERDCPVCKAAHVAWEKKMDKQDAAELKCLNAAMPSVEEIQRKFPKGIL